MSKVDNADMPAMPQHGVINENGDMVSIGEWSGEVGLTKLEHFAGLAMQGLLSSWGNHDVTDYDEIASDAVMAAKALLTQLEKGDE